MKKLDMQTKDLTQSNIEKIKALFPNAVTESSDGKGGLKHSINFDILKQELSGDIIEDGEECYDFTWVGKNEAIMQANTPINKTLRPCIEESKDWENTENLYIEGDNLEVLKLLQESYLNKVKMIYIDPPYNTGKDFVYRDKRHIDKNEYIEETEQIDEDENRLFQNTETNGRFHSDWCTMLYPRLKLARNLLSEDGVIFISIDDNEVNNLRKICDEIFGESNFVAQFIWKSKLGKVGTTNTIVNLHEYILCYAKIYDSLVFKMIESSNDGRKESLRQWGQADRREDRPSMFYPITMNGIDVYPIKTDGTEGRWRVGREKANELLEKGLLELSESNGIKNIIRTFEASTSSVPYGSLLLDEVGTTAKGSLILKSLNMSNIFDYSKPITLLSFFEMLCTNENDIILDFFSGSATTAHATIQLNSEDGGERKFIMVQLDEPTDEKSEAYKAGYKNICEIGKERIRRAGEKIKEEILSVQPRLGEEPKELPDIGFRVLKVADTNMKDVYYSADEYQQTMLDEFASNIKEDRTDMDLLYQVLLDWGLPLSLKHNIEDFEGYTLHTVDENALIACFNDNLSEELIREMAKRQPLRVVFRDSCFKDSPDKINVEEIFKLHAPNTSVRVI